jgi:hypothetical protein
MAKNTEASPSKSAVKEILALRKSFRECVSVYTARVENQLTLIRDKVLAQETQPKEALAHLRDLRDLTTLCRTLVIKPEKGRRKDLKKMDLLIDEIERLTQKW